MIGFVVIVWEYYPWAKAMGKWHRYGEEMTVGDIKTASAVYISYKTKAMLIWPYMICLWIFGWVILPYVCWQLGKDSVPCDRAYGPLNWEDVIKLFTVVVVVLAVFVLHVLMDLTPGIESRDEKQLMQDWNQSKEFKEAMRLRDSIGDTLFTRNGD